MGQHVQRTGLTSDSTIQHVLNQPAFAGFGRLILPWDDGAYNPRLPLRQIASLMPYHSRVNTVDVVSALNRMLADAESGLTIFYDFYNERQRRDDPVKANTGIFSSGAGKARLLRSSLQVAASLTSVHYTRAFLTAQRSAANA